MSLATPILWALPWVLPPVVAFIRARHSRWLDDISPAVPHDAPLVSVIIPARDEARNIDRCVRSVLATRYAPLEVIVVNDHSSDGTDEIAQSIAATDPRLRVIDAPDLPVGWFGKQWACATGARAARGELLLFTDADTRHGDDLLPRTVNALRGDNADLLTIAGHQEMHSFWERVLQPQIFALLAIRFGGTEHVSHARRAEDVIANGQFILVRRAAYEAIGGHESVRDQVAEDLALAQGFFRARCRILMLVAIRQFSTHMYASLSELIAGWRKNVYAGGRYAVLGGAVGRAAYPALLLSFPIMGLAPLAALVLSVAGLLSTSWLIWAGIVVTLTLLFWAAIYRFVGEPVWYALAYPLGLTLFFYISVASIARGRRVVWKDRAYIAR